MPHLKLRVQQTHQCVVAPPDFRVDTTASKTRDVLPQIHLRVATNNVKHALSDPSTDQPNQVSVTAVKARPTHRAHDVRIYRHLKSVQRSMQKRMPTRQQYIHRLADNVNTLGQFVDQLEVSINRNNRELTNEKIREIKGVIMHVVDQFSTIVDSALEWKRMLRESMDIVLDTMNRYPQTTQCAHHPANVAHPYQKFAGISYGGSTDITALVQLRSAVGVPISHVIP